MDDTKQVIVIRKDLKMRRGKEMAQASHASMAFLTRKLPNPELTSAEQAWLDGSFKKVVCQVDSKEALLEIYFKAFNMGIEVSLITDIGCTEFNGVRTHTCIAIGPDYSSRIDEVTKDLKLY